MTFLHTVPMKLAEANAFIAEHHRHHKPVKFHLFSLGVADHHNDDQICGCAIVMRPVATKYNGCEIAEVSRLATDGTKNACSFLLSRAARAAFAIGYKAIMTYSIPEEGGASLRGAGWVFYGQTTGTGWSNGQRTRKDKHPLGRKDHWFKNAPELTSFYKHPPTSVKRTSEKESAGDQI